MLELNYAFYYSLRFVPFFSFFSLLFHPSLYDTMMGWCWFNQSKQAIVQRHLTPSLKILAFATHPGAVSTNQLHEQYKEAYGAAIGTLIETVNRPIFRQIDQGSLSALWSGVDKKVREGVEKGEYRNGEYFTDPEELGGESGESQDQEVSYLLVDLERRKDFADVPLIFVYDVVDR